jgi:hypothetical protein
MTAAGISEDQFRAALMILRERFTVTNCDVNQMAAYGDG